MPKYFVAAAYNCDCLPDSAPEDADPTCARVEPLVVEAANTEEAGALARRFINAKHQDDCAGQIIGTTPDSLRAFIMSADPITLATVEEQEARAKKVDAAVNKADEVLGAFKGILNNLVDGKNAGCGYTYGTRPCPFPPEAHNTTAHDFQPVAATA